VQRHHSSQIAIAKLLWGVISDGRPKAIDKAVLFIKKHLKVT
jgi:hypothetical protein